MASNLITTLDHPRLHSGALIEWEVWNIRDSLTASLEREAALRERAEEMDRSESVMLEHMKNEAKRWEAENATLTEQLHKSVTAATELKLLVMIIDHTLRVPAAEYVQAISDVFALIDAYDPAIRQMTTEASTEGESE